MWLINYRVDFVIKSFLLSFLLPKPSESEDAEEEGFSVVVKKRFLISRQHGNPSLRDRLPKCRGQARMWPASWFDCFCMQFGSVSRDSIAILQRKMKFHSEILAASSGFKLTMALAACAALCANVVQRADPAAEAIVAMACCMHEVIMRVS